MAALQRAVALEQVHDVAVRSANTWTSMWRGRRRYSRAARGRRRTTGSLALARLRERLRELAGRVDDAHALAAAAGRRP